MSITIGMRAKDLRAYMQVARNQNLIILVRHSNKESLKYIGVSGYYPKPAAVKAKTADQDSPPLKQWTHGMLHGLPGAQTVVGKYQIAGLVVHPGFQPLAHEGTKAAKVQKCWDDTMKTLAPTLVHKPVDLSRPDTWSLWGKEHQGVMAPRWKWKVDVDPKSSHFGSLQMKSDTIPWSYIHGDYDLKDVIVLGKESDNRRNKGNLDGVDNFTPILYGTTFKAVRQRLNASIGIDMIQHGAEAQFRWHGDEPITVIYPDWRFLTLLSAATVQSWYRQLNRDVIGKMDIDYQSDRSRMFHFGPQGMFKPGHLPAETWG